MGESHNFRTSQDLFEDSLSLEPSQSEDVNVNDSVAWRGVELSTLTNYRYELIPSVIPSSFHVVAFKLPLENGKCPLPHPKYYEDTWDNIHVRMPCSKRNLIRVSEEETVAGWPMIKERLKSNLSCARDIQQAISSYAWTGGQRWKFNTLHKFFRETLSEAEADYFFENVFPGMIELAVSLDKEVTAPIPLLRRHKSYNISISQRQAACILANAFFCTFQDRNFAKESRPYPSINFTRLFMQGGELPQEKLKCFINYFRQACNRNLDGVITYSRRSINPSNLPSWLTSKKYFTKLHISSEGTIENEGQGMLQVDFANMFIGGGVLGFGAVQEEITFLLCPELIVSRLFTECLDDTETLIITGAERFNKHTGYSSTFKWAGAYDDRNTPRDSYKRKCRTIVALDALRFKYTNTQYNPKAIFRDINKAYCGFSFGSEGKDKISIATGNWGCGAFKGDAKLKALIQMIAAAQSNRDLVYFTFYDNELRNAIFSMHSFLVANNITVGQLCAALEKYHIYVSQIGDVPLYDYLYSILLDLDKISELYEEEALNSNENESCSYEKKKNVETPNDVVMAEELPESKENQSKNETSMEETSMELSLPTSEPIKAETYSLKTEEGRKRCIQSEKERWKAYESAKTLLTPTPNKSDKHHPKKKISDYFLKTPKNT